MNTLDDIAREQAVPAADEEEKKRKKKRNLLVGLAALAVIGGSAVCVGTGIVDKLKPAPEPTQEVAVRVEPTDTAYAPIPAATAVTLSPTPTSPVEAYDVREAWYGNYDGTASGRTTNWKNNYTGEFENSRFELKIFPNTWCFESLPNQPFCDEDTSWGVDIRYGTAPGMIEFAEILVYLPANLSDAPNLTITDSRLAITPTEEQPYELVIEMVNGHLEGYLHTDGRLLEQWTEDAFAIPYLDHFAAERTTAGNPFVVP